MNPYQTTPFSAIHLPKGDAMKSDSKCFLLGFIFGFVVVFVSTVGGAAFEYFLLRK